MDRRRRKTQQAIFKAFEELMSEEHYSQVTVAQIIVRADVGRSTFYGNFETKDDLTDRICKEMFDHIFSGVNDSCATHADLDIPGLRGMLAHLLYHLRDAHSGVCGKLLMEGEPHFTTYFREKLTELFEANMPEVPPEVPDDLMKDMLVSSFCEAVSWWFKGGCAHEPERVATWFLLTIGGE